MDIREVKEGPYAFARRRYTSLLEFPFYLFHLIH